MNYSSHNSSSVPLFLSFSCPSAFPPIQTDFETPERRSNLRGVRAAKVLRWEFEWKAKEQDVKVGHVWREDLEIREERNEGNVRRNLEGVSKN